MSFTGNRNDSLILGVFNVFGRLIRFWIIFIAVFLYASPLAAGLSDFHYRIIEIAFMNGYASVLKYDLEKIKSLKESTDEMKRYAKLEVDRYMLEVDELNRVTQKREDIIRVKKAYRPISWR